MAAEAVSDVARLIRANADRSVRGRLAAAMVLVVVGGLLAALAPLALKGMVDAVAAVVVSDANAEFTLRSAALLGATYLFTLCVGRLLVEIRPAISGGAEQRLHARLRESFFCHLLALPLAFHLRQKSGALLHTLQQGTMACQLLVSQLINGVVPVVVELVAVMLVLAHLDQPALVINFAITAVAFTAVVVNGALPLQRQARAVSDANLQTHATLADHLVNIEAVKCFAAESAVRLRLAATSRELEQSWSRLHHQRASIGLATVAVFAVSVAVSLALSGAAVVRGELTVGGFVIANVYMLQMVRPLEALSSAARDVSQALAFIQPLLDVLKTSHDTPAQSLTSNASGDASAVLQKSDGAHTAPHPASQLPAVQFENVHFAYDGSQAVLRGFNLHVATGSSVAIVGPTGGGKSSIVRLLLRLYEPQAGRILVNGAPVTSRPIADIRALFGLVPQDTVLFNDSIAANIGIGRPGASQQEVEEAAQLADLHGFVKSLPAGYGTQVGERGLKLSGGERQRVAIARALLKRPRIFVLDEATSMLDSQTEATILRNLQAVTNGCTTLVIAHRLSSVMHADEIVVLSAGQVAERGSHHALLAKNGPYARLWQAQGALRS